MSDGWALAPRIGIAPLRRREAGDRASLVARESYLTPLIEAQAIPVLLLPTPAAAIDRSLESLDGILFPGGADIDPRHYGQEPAGRLKLEDDDVATFQLELARASYRRGLPTLGICLGCQVLNVALGGSLIQDLDSRRPGAVGHAGRGRSIRHQVSLEPGSRLFAALGVSGLEVPSQHHQAVDRVGSGLKVVAVAADAVIEAIEAPELQFFMGVQWHPEQDLSEPGNRRLFEAFLRSAADAASA